MLADLGRPRNARIGIIDFNCFGVSGCASGSALAAAVMTLSSCAEGIATEARLGTFYMVFYLATIGSAQAYDPSHLATIYKGPPASQIPMISLRPSTTCAISSGEARPSFAPMRSTASVRI